MAIPVDGFDSYSDGSFNGGSGGTGWSGNWVVTGTNIAIQGTVTHDSSTKAVKHNNYSGEASATRDWSGDATGIMQCAMRRGSSGDRHAHVFGIYDVDVGRLGYVVLDDGGLTQWYGATSDTSWETGLSEDAWYVFEIEWDCSTNKIRFRRDGGTWTSWADFEASRNGVAVDRVWLFQIAQAGTTAADLYWDTLDGEYPPLEVDVFDSVGITEDITALHDAWAYEQDFEGLNTGNLEGQDSWTSDSTYSTDIDVSTTGAIGGSQSAYCGATGNANGRVKRSITAVSSGEFYVSMRADETLTTGSYGIPRFYLYSSTTLVGTLTLYDDGVLLSHSGGDTEILSYTDGTTVRLGVEFDVSTDQFRFSLNNGTWSSYYSFVNNVSSVDVLKFAVLNAASDEMWWDDISGEYETSLPDLEVDVFDAVAIAEDVTPSEQIGTYTVDVFDAVAIAEYTQLSPWENVSTFQDNFDDNSRNTTLWGIYESFGTVTETNTQMELQLDPDVQYAETGLWAEKLYSLYDSSCTVGIFQAAADDVDTAFGLQDDYGDRLVWISHEGTSYAIYDLGYSWQSSDSASITLTSDTYFRIRETGGTVYWDYSIDGKSTWTNLHSVLSSSIAFGLGEMEPYFLQYATTAVAAEVEEVSIFDDFNTPLRVDVNDSVAIAEDVEGGYIEKISTLYDNFDDNSIDSAIWSTYTSSGGTVVETGQELVCTPGGVQYSYSALYSNVSYDLTDSSIYINCSEIADPKVYSDFIVYMPGGWSVRHRFDGYSEVISYTIIDSVTDIREYEALAPSAGTFIRIRESSGTLYWEHSTDNGQNWTTYDSMVTPFSMNSVRVQLSTYQWSAGTLLGQAVFDNLNTPLPIIVDDSVAVAEDVATNTESQDATYTVDVFDSVAIAEDTPWGIGSTLTIDLSQTLNTVYVSG